jgi:hypothetical protein
MTSAIACPSGKWIEKGRLNGRVVLSSGAILGKVAKAAI